MRLATSEEELAAATAEFSEGLKAAGPVPALDDAALSMRSATRCWMRRTFATARPHEETALKGLISARQKPREAADEK